MKRFILFVFFISFCVIRIFSQGEEAIVFTVKTENAKPSKLKSNNLTENEKLRKIFKKHAVFKYEQRFPYSKDPELLKIYRIRFYGESEKLKKELKEDAPDIIEGARVLSSPILCYDPSGDNMWKLTQQNPNEWLWHLKKIQADKAWDITKSNPNIHIAVVDTWFDINHPDLSTKISPKYDPNYGFIYNSDGSEDNHGTTVASFAAGQTDGGGQLSAVGFNSMMYALSLWDGLANAHYASLNLHADVVSISWYYYCLRSNVTEEDIKAIKEILNNNTIIVAGAGNGYYDSKSCKTSDGTGFTTVYPFSTTIDSRIICVSSTDINDNHTYYENGVNLTHSFYPEVDICAPGYNTMGAACTKNQDGTVNIWPYYGSCKGTSFATPIVSGVCALMKSIDPTLTPERAKNIIKSTADPIADANLYPGMVGAGRINAFKCVQAVGTKVRSRVSLSGNYLFSAGYSANLNNIKIVNNANILVKARKEINITGTFEVQSGSAISFEIDPDAVNTDNWDK